MKLRLLYLGNLAEGGTCLDRLRAIQHCGVEALAVDTGTAFRRASRLARSLAARFCAGPIVRSLNASLRDLAQPTSGVTHIWIDKGRWIYPETLEFLRQKTGARLVHYTPDPALYWHQSRFFLASVPLYDIHITTKSFELDAYRAAGAKRVLLTRQGYLEARFRSEGEAAPEWISDVTFIGHREPHYSRTIFAVTSALEDVRTRVWGPGWRRARWFAPWTRAVVQGDGLWGRDYPRTLRASKVCLGLLSKWIPETSTARTFEIPASGSFLLAERTPEHEQYFEEGREAEFFSTEAELVEKLRKYLSDSAARARIAAAGRLRCTRSGYSYEASMKGLLDELRQ